MQKLLQVYTERRARLRGQTDGAAQRRRRWRRRRRPGVHGGVRVGAHLHGQRLAGGAGHPRDHHHRRRPF